MTEQIKRHSIISMLVYWTMVVAGILMILMAIFMIGILDHWF
jgi:hypothetical protein